MFPLAIKRKFAKNNNFLIKTIFCLSYVLRDFNIFLTILLLKTNQQTQIEMFLSNIYLDQIYVHKLLTYCKKNVFSVTWYSNSHAYYYYLHCMCVAWVGIQWLRFVIDYIKLVFSDFKLFFLNTSQGIQPIVLSLFFYEWTCEFMNEWKFTRENFKVSQIFAHAHSLCCQYGERGFYKNSWNSFWWSCKSTLLTENVSTSMEREQQQSKCQTGFSHNCVALQRVRTPIEIWLTVCERGKAFCKTQLHIFFLGMRFSFLRVLLQFGRVLQRLELTSVSDRRKSLTFTSGDKMINHFHRGLFYTKLVLIERQKSVASK